MADRGLDSRTWSRLAWTFGLFFGFNYLTCLLTLYLLGNPLWCVFVLSIFVLVSAFHGGAASSTHRFGARDAKAGRLEVLVDELKMMEIEKIPFVIERFLQLDKASAGLAKEDAICESERCVVCLDARAAIQTLPCRHRVVCRQCAWSTLKMALKETSSHTCVLCRGEIRDFNGSLFGNLVNVKWQDVQRVLDETKAM